MVRSTSRGSWWWLAAVAASCALTGCPPSTGRHRNDPADGSAGLCLEDASNIFSGGSCSLRGDTCDTMRSCGTGGIEIDSCMCIGGVWGCTQGPCNRPGPDSGDPTCPTLPVSQGDTCSPLQGGLVCTGSGTDCSGSTVQTSCYCNGTTWFCSGLGCDAGDEPDASSSVDCPADPSPGFSCDAGSSCVYAGAPGCVTRCTCDPILEYECTDDCSGGDAGADGFAVDAGTDGSAGDAGTRDAGAFDAGPAVDF